MIPFARYKYFVMIDQFMRKAAIIKASVAVPAIGIHRATGFNMLFDESVELFTFGMAIVLTDPLR